MCVNETELKEIYNRMERDVSYEVWKSEVMGIISKIEDEVGTDNPDDNKYWKKWYATLMDIISTK